jgi:hypothetical protein
MKKTMKAWAAAAAGLALAAGAWGQSLLLQDSFRQAVQGAFLEEARTALAASPIPAGTPVAILPIDGDVDGWLAGQLKIALTEAGKNCVEGKEDPMWEAVQEEVTWDKHKEPFLDPETLDAFGKIQSAKILLTGAVRSLDQTERYAYFEVELHATEIATKRHLWGAVCAKRHYAAGFEDLGKVMDRLRPELRQAMQDSLRQKVVDSLGATPGTKTVGRVALLPLAADEREYVGGLVRDSATRAGLQLVNADWATTSEARMGLRDPEAPADAVLRGSVRDLSCKDKELDPTADQTSLRAEVQLCIETRGGAIVWSDTLTVDETHKQWKGLWGTLLRLFPSLDEHPLRAVWWPLGILLGLILLKMFLNATTRVR